MKTTGVAMIPIDGSGLGKTMRHGQFVFNHGQKSIACEVHSFTAAGITLTVGKDTVFPWQFEIEIPVYGILRPAALAWRDHENGRVEFAGNKQPRLRWPTALRDLTEENRMLQTEVRLLRSRLAGFGLGQDVARTSLKGVRPADEASGYDLGIGGRRRMRPSACSCRRVL